MAKICFAKTFEDTRINERISEIKYLVHIGAIALSYPPPPIVIDDSLWKNGWKTAESFTVALTLTLGGYKSAIAPSYPAYPCQYKIQVFNTHFLRNTSHSKTLQWRYNLFFSEKTVTTSGNSDDVQPA